MTEQQRVVSRSEPPPRRASYVVAGGAAWDASKLRCQGGNESVVRSEPMLRCASDESLGMLLWVCRS